MGAPQKDQNGLLSFNYFKNLFLEVQKFNKQSFGPEKQEFLRNRREALRNNEHTKYNELVKQMMQREEQTFGDLLQEVLDHIGVNEQEFMRM